MTFSNLYSPLIFSILEMTLSFEVFILESVCVEFRSRSIVLMLLLPMALELCAE